MVAPPLVPFRQFVLKVHSRCDLACRYCYVYEHADQSWSRRPKVVSEETVVRVAARLAEHARTHALPSVHVILHGGEPLLAGPAALRRICAVLRDALTGIAELDLRVHTNGVQLSERYLDLFAEFDVKVGISLDGDRIANDRHRRYADGRSSHQHVLNAVELLRRDRYRHLYAGLLCTIDVANDPVAVYDALAGLAPPRIDFLLPHATWDEPPVRPEDRPTYAQWLLGVFDRWDAAGRPMPVRLFDSVISTCRGGPSLTESMGVGPSDLVVIETDGTLEQADSLKIAYDGAPETGYDVFAHSFDTAAGHPGVVARQQGVAGLSATCRACPVVRSCGGGLYAHRYRAENGFDNPSVYCTDLKALVTGVSSRLAAEPTVAAGPGGPLTAVDRLAAGSDDREQLLTLAAAQRLVTRGWLTVIEERAADRGAELPAVTRQLLSRLDEYPDAMELLLGHPYLRGWAADLLAADGSDGLASMAPLTAFAASAALRGGLPGAVPVPARADGTVFLPALGLIRMAPADVPMAEAVADGDGIVVRLAGEEARVVPGTAPDARWQPVGRLTGAVVLDDLDPYRDRYARPARERLSGAGADRFGETVERAWRLLHEAVPQRLAGLTAVLTTLTPLAGTPHDAADLRLAGGIRGMGAVGLTPTGDPAALARELLHGHQLATLDALVEQTELYDEAAPWSFTVPWTESPLLTGEVLAQAYARSATTAFAADPGRYAHETARALDALTEADVLTGVGEEFVAGIRAGLPADR
ncbi:FxsB family cyclophane-forming radical SAM/SPASM peptide maturase [Streptantibioticus silvisoli]|uniref:FxsB family cyclophane-forming radical SAM/SPASM peptide maturase n=1 Tax=Streptantibioticus silvisoli TaxID=2705255 RepID=UPI003F6AC5CE